MKTLTIKDLARTEQLDRAALSTVRGGMKMSSPSYNPGNQTYAPKHDSSITAAQNLAEFQTVRNSVADGSAFVDCLHVNNTTDLFGQNNIVSHS
jgi:hypothetical protein